jgi:hypothetical protein
VSGRGFAKAVGSWGGERGTSQIHVRVADEPGFRRAFIAGLICPTLCLVKRAGCLIGTCVVVAGAIWLLWAILRDKHLYTHVERVKAGATEQEVLHELGRPKRVQACGTFWGPFPKAELEGCTKEFYYASPFAPLLPQYYVVWFDGNDRVKSVTPYSSP